MKKHLMLFCCLALLGAGGCGTTSVEEVNPGNTDNPDNPDNPDDPDNPVIEQDPFEAFLLAYFDQDYDGEISDMEADEVSIIDCTDMKIKALGGIERFRNLMELICKYNQIETLNLSRNTSLVNLDCQVNRLTQLNISGCPMINKVSCNRNALTSLDLAANENLAWLDCAENRIEELDVSSCPNLGYLDCMGNGMTALWLSRGQTIMTLKKDAGTVLKYKDMPTDAFQLYLLETFDLNHDMVLSDTEAAGVTVVDCSGRSFDMLTGLEQLVNLETLNCSGCELTSLDLTRNPSLTKVDCSSNRLQTLDVSKNRKLEELDCRQNQIAELWLEWTQRIPNCQKDATTRIQFYKKPVYFAVGDWYDDGEGVQGIVFQGGYNYSKKKLLAPAPGRSTGQWCADRYNDRIVGASSTADGAVNMAAARRQAYFEKLDMFKTAADYGEGWYPLAKDELQAVIDHLAKINEGLEQYGWNPIDPIWGIWTSTETNAACAWGYSTNTIPNWLSNHSKLSQMIVLLGHTF